MTWLLTGLVAILWAPLQVVVHEASHAIAFKLQGGTIKTFKPWPHRRNGRWWFGYVTATFLDERTADDRRRAGVAPFIVAIALIPITGLLSLAWFPLIGIGITASLDAMNWLRGYVLDIDGTDGGKIR